MKCKIKIVDSHNIQTKLEFLSNTLKRHLPFLLLMIQNLALSGQIISKGLPMIRNYTPYDYSAAAQNYDIEQDERGIMYFANAHGVLEFDGSNWDLIPVNNRSEVHSINKGAGTNMYLGAQMEFGKLNTNKIGRENYSSYTKLVAEQYRNFNEVKDTYFTDDGVFFQSDKKIFIYKNYQIKRVIRTNKHFQRAFYVNHKYYTLEEGYGLTIFKNNKLNIVAQGNQYANDHLYLILRFEHNKELIITKEKGFQIFNGFSYSKFNIKNEAEILKAVPVCGINYGVDQLIIGTKHNGIYIINKNGKLIQHINKERGLNSNKVFGIFADNQKNVWLALENGISFIEFNSPFTFFNEHNGLQGSGLSSTVLNDQLYLGTTQGLFFRHWEPGVEDDSVLNFEIVEGTEDPAFYLEKFDNKILLGHQQGTFIIDGKTHEMSTISLNPVGYKTLNLEFNDNYVLEGTEEGMLLFERKGTTGLEFKHKIQGFDDKCKYVEELDSSNLWVCHDNKGVWKITLNKALNRVINAKPYDEERGLPNKVMNKVFKVHGENLFTTVDGIYKYDKSTDSFYPDSVLNQYIGKVYVNRLFQDQKANIWFETGQYDSLKSRVTYHVGMLKRKGANNYEVVDREFKKFKGKNLDYVASIDANHIILGMEEGFIHYNFNFDKNLDAPFHSLIRGVTCTNLDKDSIIFGGTFTDIEGNKLNNQPIREQNLRYKKEALQKIDSLISINETIIENLNKVGDPEHQIRVHIAEINQLKNKKQQLDSLWGKYYHKYPHKMHSFRFQFSSNYYEDCNKTEYRYKLVNLRKNKAKDVEWSEWSKENDKEYNSLQPGEYEFYVEAKNIYGHISEPTKYQFYIRTPWYDTFWFHSTLVSFLLLMMIISLYFNRKKKLNKLTFFLTFLTLITVFETFVELAEKKLEDYHGGVLFFTILMNIILALSLNPLENYIKRSFRKRRQDMIKDEEKNVEG